MVFEYFGILNLALVLVLLSTFALHDSVTAAGEGRSSIGTASSLVGVHEDALYAQLNKTCPISLREMPFPVPAAHMYGTLRVDHYVMTYYESLKGCPTECQIYGGKSEKTRTETTHIESAPAPAPAPAMADYSVVSDRLGWLQYLTDRKEFSVSSSSSLASSGIKWCGLEDASYGHWVMKSGGDWKRGNSSGVNLTVDSLKEVMSGDIVDALKWPSVWVPKTCRLFWYNVTSFIRCAHEWRRRMNTTLWIHYVGDSTTRGEFCTFMHLFTEGGPHSGQLRGVFPCYTGYSLGERIERPPVTSPRSTSGSRYSCYAMRSSPFTVSYHSRQHVIAKEVNLEYLFQQRDRPTHILYSSGVFDFVQEKRKVQKFAANLKHKRRNTGGYYIEVRYQLITNRSRDAANLLGIASAHRYAGTLIFRNNPCNCCYDPRQAHVDPVTEQLFRDAGRRVLNVYNFSVCRGLDFLRDETHYDRVFAPEPPPEKPNLGGLALQSVQTLLNAVCNPLLQGA